MPLPCPHNVLLRDKLLPPAAGSITLATLHRKCMSAILLQASCRDQAPLKWAEQPTNEKSQTTDTMLRWQCTTSIRGRITEPRGQPRLAVTGCPTGLKREGVHQSCRSMAKRYLYLKKRSMKQFSRDMNTLACPTLRHFDRTVLVLLSFVPPNNCRPREDVCPLSHAEKGDDNNTVIFRMSYNSLLVRGSRET